jgi:hypothetical protein
MPDPREAPAMVLRDRPLGRLAQLTVDAVQR